jgi:CRISPR-associated protein Csb2
MLALNVTWLVSAYEATVAGEPEWPPHPARAFCALVSVADEGSGDDEALRWLEALPPPVVHAPPARVARREAFVVTNVVNSNDSHQTYPGRTSGTRTWTRSLPTRPLARFVWPAAEPDPTLLSRLQALARRVPYLGRSTSPALLNFLTDLPAEDPEFLIFEPDAQGRRRLRTPRIGYLSQLRSAFADPLSDRVTAQATPYRGPGDARPTRGVRSANPAWTHLITLGFEAGVVIDGRHALALASAFKAALLSRLGKPLPTDNWGPLPPETLQLLHGHYNHDTDPRRQCAVVALPFVGHPHATGDLLGVGIAISPDLETGTLTSLLRLLGFDRDPKDGPRLGTLRLGGLGPLALRRADGRRTLDPVRWTGPATIWETVLPIVLDRFPRRNYGLADAVGDGCMWAGLDRPDRVDVLAVSPVAGAPHVAKPQRRPEEGPSRPLVHARLHFSRPIHGPVLVGHFRNLGLGLCIPASTAKSAT